MDEPFDSLGLSVSWQELKASAYEVALEWNGEFFLVKVHALEKQVFCLVLQKQSHDPKLLGLGLLAAHLAHEIRTPLFVLTERLKILPLELSLKKKSLELCEHLHSIVKGLHTLSQGQRQEQLACLVASSPIDEALALARARLEREHVRVDVEMSTPIYVEGNLSQLTQVILNLVTNALDAMETTEHKHLRFKIEARESWVHVEVSDSGPGVSPELGDRLMRPYQTTKAPGKGTGLGLGLSREIARQHGGDLRLSSSSQQGACFALILPQVPTT